MILNFIVGFLGTIFGASAVFICAMLKVNSECRKRDEERKNFIDYGKIAYEELEKIEKEQGK